MGAVFFHLHNIAKIHPILSASYDFCVEIIIHAFASTHLGYCSLVFPHLQLVQNAAA